MRSIRRFTLLVVGAVIAFSGCCLAEATYGTDSVELAREVAGMTGPGAIAFSVHNASSLPAEEVAAIKHVFETELRSHGVRISGGQATSEVALTLSENVEGYLWVVAIKQGTETHVVMRAVPRTKNVTAAPNMSKIVIVRKSLLWSDTEPILDALTFDDTEHNPRLVVLEGERIVSLLWKSGHWQVSQKAPIPHERPLPRDIRGRLTAPVAPTMSGNNLHFGAYLPGVECFAELNQKEDGASDQATITVSCRQSDEPWLLFGFSETSLPGRGQTAFYGSARNFFTGALPQRVDGPKSTVPFYSLAGVHRPTADYWVFVGVDGQLHTSEGQHEAVRRNIVDWGSDIAGVNGNCGPIVLATATGDYTMADNVRGFELTGHEWAAVSPRLEFAGPITALWSSPDGDTATAVAHNLENHLYEAYELTISCP